MHRLTASVLAIALFSTAALAQTALPSREAGTKHPIPVPDNAAPQLGMKLRFESAGHLSQPALAAATRNQVVSVPNFQESFNYKGTYYNFTMVGHSPLAGSETTTVGTQIIPISFFFDGFTDRKGNPIVLDAGPYVQRTRTSPDFENYAYGTGYTQFGDAIQRAEFWRQQDGDWHTLLQVPALLKPVLVEVPSGDATLYQTQSGTIFAVMDENFFISQLNTIVQLENVNVRELPIALSYNVFLYQGSVNNCCVLGFHTAYQSGQKGSIVYVQTLAWASWASQGIFATPDIQDVLAVSHEISEWMNDPFVSNNTPAWEYPDNSGCQSNLETGDPIEVLPHPAYPVMLHGFLYHPQTEALLQWFSRKRPSNAIDGAYSYPNTSALTSPSKPCSQ